MTQTLTLGYALAVGAALAGVYLSALWFAMPDVTRRPVHRLWIASGVRTLGTATLLVVLTSGVPGLAVAAVVGFLGVRRYVLHRVVRRGLPWT